MDDLDYLQEGFDPASLTVPRLRSILVSHNVNYPASAKKSQLIEIFTDNVLPKARKILAERARARRTSKGITDADSQDSTVGDDDLMPPPPTPRTRIRKPSAKARAAEESESDNVPTMRSAARRTPRASSPVKRSSRASSPIKKTPRPSSKHPRSDTEETNTDENELQRTVRKSRKSEAVQTPNIKVEESDGRVGDTRRESAFTFDNPFQSGSSPPSGRTSSGERRRRTLGSSASKDPSRRKSTSVNRRHTEVPQADDKIHPPTSSTFEIPVSQLNGLKDYDENGVEASEEFTPEEQMELVRERAKNGVNSLGPRRPKKQTGGFNKSGPIWVILFTMLSGYAFWYRKEKIEVGYCGVGRDAYEIVPANVPVPDWARILVEPECDLCPQHAYCSENYNTQCDTDFVLKPHPLSLGGFLPLPPTCEPDGEKVRRVKAVADRAVEELRERRAKWECGDLVDEAGVPEPVVEIEEAELKKEVSKKRRKGMGEVEFEELWLGAIGEIKGRDEVSSGSDGNTTLTSTSLARLPVSCALKRSFRLALARHKFSLASLITLVATYFYIRLTLSSRAKTNAAIPALVTLTLDRLATQASLHAHDPDAYPESWISVNQLRDDVLRAEHSLSKRDAVWMKVRHVVEMNANIRANSRESKNGEISRVWEWIGALESIGKGEGGSRERRRKSGRVSWVDGELGGGDDEGAKRWEEARPIY